MSDLRKFFCLCTMALLLAADLSAQSRRDSDRDGVPDGEDLCPATAGRSMVSARGCSALEIIDIAPLVVGSAARAVEKAGGFFGDSAEFASVRDLIADAGAALEASLDALNNGHPCRAADRHRAAGAALEEARTTMRRLIVTRTVELNRRDFALLGARHDHFGDGVMQVVAMEIGESHIADAIEVAARSEEMIAAPCAAARPVFARGIVESIDDAARRIRLDSGKEFRLADGQYALFEGAKVQITGVDFGDDTGVATAVLADSVALPSPNVPDIGLAPCIELRIAPVQRFLYSPGPYTLHHPDAYFHDPRLWLEKGMRFGAVKQSSIICDSPANAKSFRSYSLKLDLEYTSTVAGLKNVTLANELREGQKPVEIPGDLNTTKNATLTVREQYRNCHKSKKPFPAICGAPITMKTRTHLLRVEPVRFYASASYKSRFDLEDDDFVSWRPAQALATMLHGQLNLGPGFPFRAEGCKVVNNVSSCDLNSVMNIVGNQTFAVYNHDFFDADALFPMYEEAATGVDHAAGLMWPRLYGTRNGHEFWYSAQVPSLVRDVIDFCVTFPNTYYRYPFYPASPVWNLGNGNWKQDGSGHCGKDEDGNVVPFNSCLQRYAFDFGAAEGVQIRAARGGVVTKKKESATSNQKACYQQADTSGCDNGNYIFIRHQDGSYGVYWHFKGNEIYFEQGDKVHRGDVLGQNGNTGNSSGPHLHFHVQQCSGIDCGFSTLVRFQTQTGTCHTPQNGEEMLSNNDPSFW